ncbi:hypothetical protein [Streptomyces sp. B21-083]|uniref:hypothetical protein n=1 Tax=Streptomyces sp. B21-083 TaxID=3039410 RepID=UPI002FF0A525
MGDLRLKRTRKAASTVWARLGRVRKVTALSWSRLGYAGGCLTTAAGVAVEFGTGWALMAGGVVAAASFLLLVDVDKSDSTGGGRGR